MGEPTAPPNTNLASDMLTEEQRRELRAALIRKRDELLKVVHAIDAQLAGLPVSNRHARRVAAKQVRSGKRRATS